MQDEFYTLQEVAEMLKISYMTVFRWVKNGKLEASRVGKQYRIKKETLVKFTESKNKQEKLSKLQYLFIEALKEAKEQEEINESK